MKNAFGPAGRAATTGRSNFTSRAAVFGDPRHPYTQRLLAAVPIPDPKRRRERRGISSEELKSPVRPLDYEPPERIYAEVSHEHFVQVSDAWQGRGLEPVAA